MKKIINIIAILLITPITWWIIRTKALPIWEDAMKNKIYEIEDMVIGSFYLIAAYLLLQIIIINIVGLLQTKLKRKNGILEVTLQSFWGILICMIVGGIVGILSPTTHVATQIIIYLSGALCLLSIGVPIIGIKKESEK